MNSLPRPLRGGEGWPWVGEPTPPEQLPDIEWPRLTVVTVCFNSETYIEQTIRSVLLQGYPNLEYIIVDAASTDGTLDIIRHYEQHLAWWVSEPDGGQSEALNKGFARSTGELLAWLNSDDYYLPNTLLFAGQQFVKHPQLDWLVGSVRHVNAYGRYIETTSTEKLHFFAGQHFFTNGIDYRHAVDQPAVFWTRRFWDAAGPLDETYHYAMDIKLWMQAFRLGFVPKWVPDELTAFRFHPASKMTHKVALHRALARIFWEAAWKSGFRWTSCMKWAKYYLREMWLSAADQHIEQKHPLRAAAAITLAMIATPRVIQRRLYTWRQIASLLIPSRSQS